MMTSPRHTFLLLGTCAALCLTATSELRAQTPPATQAEQPVAKKPAPKKAAIDWNEAEIDWLPYKEGLARAKKKKLPMLLLRHASWCSDCKVFAKVFHDEAVIKASRELVMVHVDVDDEEESEGTELTKAQHYIPHLVFLDASGTLLPITAEDTAASDSPYFYGSDPAHLLQRMKLARTGAASFGKLTLPIDFKRWFGTTVADSSMLPPCELQWRPLEKAQETTFICPGGFTDEVLPGKVNTGLSYDSNGSLTHIITSFDMADSEKRARARTSHALIVKRLDTMACRPLPLKFPAAMSEEIKKEVLATITRWGCKKQGVEVDVLHHPEKVLMVVISQNNTFITRSLEGMSGALQPDQK